MKSDKIENETGLRFLNRELIPMGTMRKPTLIVNSKNGKIHFNPALMNQMKIKPGQKIEIVHCPWNKEFFITLSNNENSLVLTSYKRNGGDKSIGIAATSQPVAEFINNLCGFNERGSVHYSVGFANEKITGEADEEIIIDGKPITGWPVITKSAHVAYHKKK